jgi:hypothetical protein
MTEYSIRLEDEPKIEKGDNGNFAVVKGYNVTRDRAPVNGIIIQYVQKTSCVVDASGKKYDSSRSIEELTSGSVKYSNDSYFEIFYLDDNGSSVDLDSFANNSLTKYEKIRRDLIPYTYEVGDPEYETFKTKGEINVIGTNCFISKTNINYSKITSLPWNQSKNTPANGLPFLPFSSENFNLIFGSSDSNILIHKVNVTWSFENPKSDVTSSVIENQLYAPLPLNGGKRRKRRRTKRYRRSQNKKRSYKLSGN